MRFVFFSVSENGENGLGVVGDEGADGGNPPQNFWARTAPENRAAFNHLLLWCRPIETTTKKIRKSQKRMQLMFNENDSDMYT